MLSYFQLTEEQEKAVKSLERALKKCQKANVLIHNEHGRLMAYDGNIVKVVEIDMPSKYCLSDPENEGYIIHTEYDFDSFCDDPCWHFVHLVD